MTLRTYPSVTPSAAPVLLTDTDRQAVDRAFTALASMPHTCAHCNVPGTTRCGALWRTGQGDALYYLHSQCLMPYKKARTLQSVEGRIALRRPAMAAVGGGVA